MTTGDSGVTYHDITVRQLPRQQYITNTDQQWDGTLQHQHTANTLSTVINYSHQNGDFTKEAGKFENSYRCNIAECRVITEHEPPVFYDPHYHPIILILILILIILLPEVFYS